MCGIWCSYFVKVENPEKYIFLLKHRGPDAVKIIQTDNYCLGFTHLSINGSNGMQPLEYETIKIICNGEIYNYKELARQYNIEIPEGGSDCSILPELYTKVGIDKFCKIIVGVFAMIIIDDGQLIVIRDAFGVRPLFEEYGIFSSEAKALPQNRPVRQFPPGTYYKDGEYTRFHTLSWGCIGMWNDQFWAHGIVRKLLLDSVYDRLLSDKPIGALLSGGLDSSLIVALLSAYIPKINTFSIGLADSEDLRHARIVADHLKTTHHEIIITPQEYLDAIPHVIKDIESYDVTTVRASVGNWLVGRYIRKNTGIKVVFNGDGSDEVFGGYKYFQKAPSDEAFMDECMRRVNDICYFDGLRSDRCMAAHGLEARTPYLDKKFVDAMFNMPVHLKRTVLEKELLRNSFWGYLPEKILYRKKEAFSDGMSQNVPWSSIVNEELYYRDIYDSYFKVDLIPYKWMPLWSPEANDPSAKTLNY
jgi:asparagine synthase (glutamine-hydrolysing)